MIRTGLFRFFGIGEQPSPSADSWKGHEASYVVIHRKQIEEIARELSGDDIKVSARYVPEYKCAEVHFGCGLTYFQVRMHGEFGSPYEVVVTSVEFLNEKTKAVIRSIFLKDLKIEYRIKISG